MPLYVGIEKGVGSEKSSGRTCLSFLLLYQRCRNLSRGMKKEAKKKAEKPKRLKKGER